MGQVNLVPLCRHQQPPFHQGFYHLLNHLPIIFVPGQGQQVFSGLGLAGIFHIWPNAHQFQAQAFRPGAFFVGGQVVVVNFFGSFVEGSFQTLHGGVGGQREFFVLAVSLFPQFRQGKFQQGQAVFFFLHIPQNKVQQPWPKAVAQVFCRLLNGLP